ncbi:MAG: AI-2E family transporter [Pseudomonadota bacterium]
MQSGESDQAEGARAEPAPTAPGPLGQPTALGKVAGLGAERQAAFWLIAAIGLILLIGLLKEVLLPFVIGIVLAYCLNPLADFLERNHIPRGLGSALIVAVLMVLLVLALVYLVPILVTQARDMAVALPGQMQELKVLMENLARERLGSGAPQAEKAVQDAFEALNTNWDSMASWAAQSLWTQGKALFNLLTLMLITPLVVFYILVDWKPMLRQLDSYLPRQHAGPLRVLAHDINGAVGAFIRGQGTVCVILGVSYAIGLSAVGLNYGMLIGLATGVGSFVPFVGWMLGTIVATTLAVVQFWPDVWPIMLVLGVFMAGQVLDSSFLSPQIVGSRVGLHPVWVIFALIAFSYLFGIVGVLVAIPLAAAVAVIVRFALRAYLDSAVYTGEVSQPVDERS